MAESGITSVACPRLAEIYNSPVQAVIVFKVNDARNWEASDIVCPQYSFSRCNANQDGVCLYRTFQRL